MANNNNFDIKVAMDKLNLVKQTAEMGIDVQDKVMDICEKQFKGSKIIRDNKERELNNLIQDKERELSMLIDIKDLDELHKKKKSINDFFDPQISRIENELKNCDNDKMSNSEKIVDAGIKVLKTTALLLASGAAGYGVSKLIEHSNCESALECSVDGNEPTDTKDTN